MPSDITMNFNNLPSIYLCCSLQHGDNAVYWAARQGQIAAMDFLREQGCPLDAQNKVS